MKIKTLLFLICLAVNLSTISTLQCAAAAGAGAGSKEDSEAKQKDYIKLDSRSVIMSFNKKHLEHYVDSMFKGMDDKYAQPDKPLKFGNFRFSNETLQHVYKINYNKEDISYVLVFEQLPELFFKYSTKCTSGPCIKASSMQMQFGDRYIFDRLSPIPDIPDNNNEEVGFKVYRISSPLLDRVTRPDKNGNISTIEIERAK